MIALDAILSENINSKNKMYRKYFVEISRGSKQLFNNTTNPNTEHCMCGHLHYLTTNTYYV